MNVTSNISCEFHFNVHAWTVRIRGGMFWRKMNVEEFVKDSPIFNIATGMTYQVGMNFFLVDESKTISCHHNLQHPANHDVTL